MNIRDVLVLIGLLCWMAVLGMFAWVIVTAGKDRLLDHFIRYARSYLVGAIFVVLSLLGSFVAEFEHIDKAARLQFDAFDWALHFAAAGASALTTILAFLNQTNSNDRLKPTPDAKQTLAPDPAGAGAA